MLPALTLLALELYVKLSANTDNMSSLENILQELDLPPSSQKIYKELLERGEATARTLSLRLRLTRPSTYDHLSLLKKKGLVVEFKRESTTYFAVDDVRHVGNALKERIEKLTEHEKMFSTMLPQLLKESKTETPKIKFFEGKEGLTYLLYDVLWNKGETIYTMWPHKEMEKVLDKEAMVRFNERRIQEKIIVHALWPHQSKPNKSNSKDYIWQGKDQFTKRKYAPKDMSWSMGYTIYDDKVSFISSEKEVFGFIVQSSEFSKLMRMQFEVLWNLSK
ncbi:MAG: transcriptional regulator, TrmB [Candidatus Nomurabacteria bacterium]|nr:transcriptional regulator, TrmB [Candidatus Nomurabacteria bacterium]